MTYVCKLYNNLQDSKSILNFSNNVFEAAEFLCIVSLTTILCLLQRKNFTLL